MMTLSTAAERPSRLQGALMFRGFATVNFYADDLAAARDWYTKLLGVAKLHE